MLKKRRYRVVPSGAFDYVIQYKNGWSSKWQTFCDRHGDRIGPVYLPKTFDSTQEAFEYIKEMTND